MKKRVSIVVAIAACVAVALAIARLAPASASVSSVPTSRVTRGSLKLDVWAKGEFRASRVVSLAAPASGSSLRLVRLVGTGAAVRAGDVVMEFDPAEQHYALEQSLMDLAEADQNVARSRAELAARAASDEVILLTAGFDLRRAELDARTPLNLTSANDFKKKQLVVQEMKRRLTQTQSDVKMRRTNAEAAVTVAEEQRNRAKLAADRAQQIIDSLVVKSPIDGLVVVKENRDATGGVFFAGLSLPEYRTGDTVFSGRSIADVAATSDMEIKVRVTEQERPNLTVGQAAIVRADAAPRETFKARITALSSQAVRSTEQSGPLRQFDVTLRLDQPDARLRPGTSVRVVISGVEVKDVLTVPRQALFQQNDQSVVYLRMGDRFDARAVKVTNWSESRVAIQGAPAGAEVALVKPDARSAKAAANATMPAIGGAR